MRKLASIRKVITVEDIKNSDYIELVIVDGWKVVSKKGEFKKGDLAVYFEIDSLLPKREEFSFLGESTLKKDSEGNEGYLLKSKKMRGQVSQGLLLPIDLFEELINTELEEGKDLTEILNVRKYEKPLPKQLMGKALGPIPGYIKKTDEERIQNLSSEYSELRKIEYYITEKLDGSSITIYKRGDRIGVCSRNLELIDSEEDIYWSTVKSLRIIDILSNSSLDNIALQGELIGPGINKNRYKLDNKDIYFFTIYDIKESKKVDKDSLINTLSKLGLKMVPILDQSYSLPETIDELLREADGKSQINPSTNREGLVIRSYDSDTSFKVISNKFLLKE